MKNKILKLAVVCLGLSFLFAFGRPSKKDYYKHAVTVTFKATATEEAIHTVDESFARLQKLGVVKGYEWGVVDSKDTIKHIYIFSFSKPEDLEVYAQSPEHQAHIKIGAEDIEGVTAIQYWVK